MPQVIPMVVTAISYVGASVTAIAAGTATAMQTFAAVAAFGAAAAAGPAFAAMQPGVKPSSASIEWTAKPNAPNSFPFGRVGGAGNIIHNATYGPDKMYVGFVGVLGCSGPIHAYKGFKADDTTVTFDSNGKAVTSEYANEMWVVRQLGNQPEASALSTTGLKNGAAMPGWGSSYKLSGKAAYMYTLGENSKRSAYKGKVPTGIHTFEGLLCYDPRLDSTYPGGSGSCRLDDPTTWVYSTNAYIHALNWIIGRWEGLATGYTPSRYGVPFASLKVGGIGARPENTDWASYVEAANVFDENEWACAAYPDADEGKASVLDSFLQAGGGIYAERQGKVSCMHRAAPRTSIATITADDTAGTIEYDTTTSLLERINTIRPEYWSEAHGWQMVATEEVSSETWRLEDGQGEEVTRSKGLAYNYVPGSKQARELAALQIAHTREGIRGTAPLRHYLDLEVGDCFEWDVPEAVLNGLKCIVLNVDPDLENDILNVTFVSETDGKYPFAFGQADAPPPAPEIDAPDFTVAPPESGDWIAVAATIDGDDGSALPTIVLTGSVENETADLVEFWYRRVGATDWLPYSADSPAVVAKYLSGLTNGDWEPGVSYRRGRRSSTITALDPVALAGYSLPLDEAQLGTALETADVIRAAPGSGGALAGALAVLDEADTVHIAPEAVNGPSWSTVAGPLVVSASYTTMSTLVVVTAGEVIRVTAGAYLSGVTSAVFSIEGILNVNGTTVWPPAGTGRSIKLSPQVAASTFQVNDFVSLPPVLLALPAGTYTVDFQMKSGASTSPAAQDILLSVERLKDVR